MRDAIASASCTWQTTCRPASRATTNHSGGVTVFTTTIPGSTLRSSRHIGPQHANASPASCSKPRGESSPRRMIGVGCSITVAPTSVMCPIRGPGPGTVTTTRNPASTSAFAVSTAIRSEP